MKIVNHKLVGAEFRPSPNRSGFMNPTGAIMHYTAGFSARSAISTLCNPRAKVSAHVVIDTDGTITQLVEFNRVAWHAGPSRLGGRSGCNNFTIGFEFVNPGYFQVKDDVIYDWTGKHRLSQQELSRWDLSCRARNSKLGSGTYVWPGYSRAQIEAGLALFDALVDEYGLTMVAGHEEIDTRGWKTDPGPAFPMDAFEQVLKGNQFADVDQNRSDSQPRANDRRTVDVARLNVRAGPGIRFRIVGSLRAGQTVNVLKDTGDWSRIEFDHDKIGWIADSYLRDA